MLRFAKRAHHGLFHALVPCLVALLQPANVAAVVCDPASAFSSSGSFSCGSRPHGIAVGDLNGDSHLDFVVANSDAESPSPSGSVVLLLGQGDGTFGAAQLIDTVGSPFDVAISDFDGDSHLDVVVADNPSGNIWLRLGHGDGTFDPRIEYFVGGRPFTIAAADLNGDGVQDVAVTQNSSSSVAVLLGAGGGTLGTPASYPVGYQPSGITIADITQDGIRDLCVASYGYHYIALFRGIGDGTFAPPDVVDVGWSPWDIIVTDLNADSTADLVASGAAISVALGSGGGAFGAAQQYSAGGSALGIVADDYDRDGVTDIVAALGATHAVGLLTGRSSSGGPDGSLNTGVLFGADLFPADLASGDFDEDGHPDLVAAAYHADAVSVLLSRCEELSVPPPPLPVVPVWESDGRPLVARNGGQRAPLACTDGAGGAYVAWLENRGGVDEDIYAIRVHPSGEVASGWLTDGNPVCTSAGTPVDLHLVPDGAGNALLAWSDLRSGPPQVYVHRLLSSGGIAPGWPVGGLRVCHDSTSAKDLNHMAADGAGGAYVTWEDSRFPGIYCTRVTGQAALAPGWSPTGTSLGWSSNPEFRYIFSRPYVVAAGTGGAYFAFALDLSVCTPSCYSVTSSNLRHLDPGSGLLWDVRLPNILDPLPFSDGAFGSFVWPRGSPLRLARVHPSGQVLWNSLVTASPPIGSGLNGTSDGTGGATLTWIASGASGRDVFAQRIRSNGQIAPGWSYNGVLVCSAVGNQTGLTMISDGSRGMILAWEDPRTDPGDIYVQRMGAGGTPPYGASNGLPICTAAGRQSIPVIVPSGAYDALIFWEDGRSDEADIYMHRVTWDAAVHAVYSVVETATGPGWASVRWWSPDPVAAPVMVERHSADADWSPAGIATTESGGYLLFEDRRAMQNHRLGYRLALPDGIGTTGEVWLEIPGELLLALEGARPNPTIGELAVAFSLPNDESANLEVLDLAGRRVAMEEVGHLGAGRHVMRFNDGARIAPGIYWIRLTHFGSVPLVTRACVIR